MSGQLCLEEIRASGLKKAIKAVHLLPNWDMVFHASIATGSVITGPCSTEDTNRRSKVPRSYSNYPISQIPRS